MEAFCSYGGKKKSIEEEVLSHEGTKKSMTYRKSVSWCVWEYDEGASWVSDYGKLSDKKKEFKQASISKDDKK